MNKEITYKEVVHNFMDVERYISKAIEKNPFIRKEDRKKQTMDKLVWFMIAYDDYLRNEMGVRTSFLMDDFATTGMVRFIESPDEMKIPQQKEEVI